MKFQNLRFKFVIMFFLIVVFSSFVAGLTHLFINWDAFQMPPVDTSQKIAVENIKILSENTNLTLEEIADKVKVDGVTIEVTDEFPEDIVVHKKSYKEKFDKSGALVGLRRGKPIKTAVLILDGRYISVNKASFELENFMSMIVSLLEMVALCVIFATAATFVVSKHALKPIRRLSSAMQQVASGNFKIQLETHSKDEIGMLTESFNMMTKELDGMETLRDDFISNVSHEFKTPISSIKGFAELLRDDSLPRCDKREYIDIIVDESDRLTKLSSNILHLSKLDNQKIDGSMVEFSLDETIRRCIVTLEPEWKKKDIELDINMENIKFYGDHEMLSLAWLNLIGNAIKFTDKFGQIKISLQKENNRIIFVVTDNGVGISESAKPYLFDKFYQEDLSHSTAGNGLGLTLVKTVVEKYDGRVSVESQKGQGSSFTVEMPINDVSLNDDIAN